MFVLDCKELFVSIVDEIYIETMLIRIWSNEGLHGQLKKSSRAVSFSQATEYLPVRSIKSEFN